MSTLILLRHGRSDWNDQNLFTGWWDVDLSPAGEAESVEAGRQMAEAGLLPDVVHTSVLTRATRSAALALAACGRSWVPVRRTWRLNERHYGALQGLDKAETLARHGEVQFQQWRRSYDVPPPPIERGSAYDVADDPRYADLPPEMVPTTECLADVVARMEPYWADGLAPDLRAGRVVLVAAHGNSLRALVKQLEGISDADIASLNLATGVPRVYDIGPDLRPTGPGRDLGDPEEVARRAAAVAAQGKGRGPAAPPDPSSSLSTPSSENRSVCREAWSAGEPVTDAPTTSSRRESVKDFLATEAASGTVLVFLAVVALIWANGPAAEEYESLFATQLGPLDLHTWVNDGLMALFFLVVGLEIKRELVIGELQDRRAAALPALAALGGMVVPALVFLALAGDGARRGWGAPMATDIAFALGVIGLLGKRVPSAARLFLLTLAIVDDLGAIAVIAVVYSGTINLAWLAGAVVAVLGVALLKGRWWALLTLGPVAWWCTHESGVHATIAGVALGLVIPVSRGEGYEHRMHPYTSFLVVPIFALANAGVVLSGAFDAPGAGRLAVAVGVGLVIGKLVGVAGATWLALRLRVGVLPEGMGAGHVIGIAAMAGIGFTVSLFVVDLAYLRAPALAAGAKIGVLAASVIAAALGAALLYRVRPEVTSTEDEVEVDA